MAGLGGRGVRLFGWVLSVAWSTSVVLPGCHRVFSCERDEQCRLDGTPGVCELDGYCSFPDPDCPSGRRYGEHASRFFAGECVPESAAGSEESTSSTSSTTDDGTTSPDAEVTSGSAETTSSTGSTESTGTACVSYEELVRAEEGLRLWHRMDEQRIGPAVDDAQGLDGEYHVGAGAELEFGVAGPGGTGNAVRFHGVPMVAGAGIQLNARVRGQGPSFMWFQPDTTYSIELWYRAEHGASTGTSPLLTVEDYLVFGFRFRFRHNLRTLLFSGWPSGIADPLEVDAGSFGEWHHVVLTVEPSDDEHRFNLYVDGKHAGEAEAAWELMHQCPTDPCMNVAGFVGSGQGQQANIAIDEFAVYEGVLSPETIAAHEQAGRHDCAGER